MYKVGCLYRHIHSILYYLSAFLYKNKVTVTSTLKSFGFHPILSSGITFHLNSTDFIHLKFKVKTAHLMLSLWQILMLMTKHMDDLFAAQLHNYSCKIEYTKTGIQKSNLTVTVCCGRSLSEGFLDYSETGTWPKTMSNRQPRARSAKSMGKLGEGFLRGTSQV